MSIHVSCIIHCQDATNLERAVASCLSQGDDVETIIVADGLEGAGHEAAQRIAEAHPARVRIVRNEHISSANASRSLGALFARGRFLCFLHPDDELLAGFAAGCAALLSDHPELAAAHVLLEIVNPDGSQPLPADDARVVDVSASYPSGVMVRREAFLALAGAWQDNAGEGSMVSDDYAMLGALTRLFRCTRIPVALARHHLRSVDGLEAFLARTPGMSSARQEVARERTDMVVVAEAVHARARDALSSLEQCRQPLPSSAIKQEEGAPFLTFVTVSKGRLHHLKQTLPLLAALKGVEVVVVDYACPQGSGDWVAQHYPGVRIGRVTDDPGFNLPRARNIGASAATTPWICFIDADVAITDGLMAWAGENLRPGAFYRPQPIDAEGYGSFFCPREGFVETGGYDEAIQSWGGEDDDFYQRLKRAGYREDSYPSSLVSLIRHGDEERTKYYQIKDRAISHHLYQWYSVMKYDLMAIRNGPLPLEERLGLMQLARETLARVAQDQRREAVELFSVELGEREDTTRFTEWKVERKLVYRRIPRSA